MGSRASAHSSRQRSLGSFSRANCSKIASCRCIICISASSKIASHAIFGGVEMHIMHLKIHIMHLADQKSRFTNPGCQSKNCHIKIRLRRSANLQKPLCVPLRVPGPTASSIRRSTTCTHFKKCFTHRERHIHTGRHHQIPPLRGATRHANASGVARNPTQNAHFGGNWRKIGLSRASIICVLQMHIMDFKTHNMDYFGRC